MNSQRSMRDILPRSALISAATVKARAVSASLNHRRRGSFSGGSAMAGTSPTFMRPSLTAWFKAATSIVRSRRTVGRCTPRFTPAFVRPPISPARRLRV
jgi:hypothetical protein